MADVTSLSDAKLRSELIQLGFVSPPVTSTTRGILEKKLVKLRSERKKPPKRASIAVPSRKVLGLSSDESENDTGARSAKTRQANLRRRSARGRLTTATRRRSTQPDKEESDDDSNDENVDNDLPTASTFSFLRRNEPNYEHTANAQARPNNSNNSPKSHKPNLGERNSSKNRSFNNTQRAGAEFEPVSVKSNPSKRISPFSRPSFLRSKPANEFSDSDVDHDDQKLGVSKTYPSVNDSKSTRPSIYPKQRSFAADRSDLNRTFNVSGNATPDRSPNETAALRSRRSLNSTPKTSTPRKSHSFNQTNPASVVGNRANSTKRSDSAYQTSQRRGGQSSDASLPEQVFATEENLSSSLASKYSHVVSMVLLVCAFMFFVILGVLYISVGSEDIPDKRLLIGCSGPCEKDLKFKIAQAVFDKLCERAGLFQCGYLAEKEDDKMKRRDLVVHLEQVFANEEGIPSDTIWAERLFNEFLRDAKDEDWGIRFFATKNGDPLDELYLVAEINYLSSEHPALPWLCRVRRSASVVVFRLGVIFLVVLSIWLTVLYMKYYWRKQEEEREKVHAIVEKILDLLAKHHRACQNDSKNNQPYQAIPHVRDSIIAPAERQKMQRIWNKAVHFINTHESRVRVETQRIEGEEFQVWRWVQAVPTTHHTSFAPVMELELNPKRTRVWQGTAFDNPETAVKMRSYSPTECLKIRNMFDISLESSEHWEVAIEDAVLERCGSDHGIVHVAADKTSTEGCVYVKFVSPAKAGEGFRKLHGSWFDGKLITVKFLRLERYHTRFPQAVGAVTTIRPSNNLQKSLSGINRPSGDDAT